MMTIDELATALGFDSREALYGASNDFAEESDVTWWVTGLPDGRWAAWDDSEIDLARVQMFDSESEAEDELQAGWIINHPAGKEESR